MIRLTDDPAMTIDVDLGRKATKQTIKIGFLNFSNICCWYTLELPHRGYCNVHVQHMSSQ